MTSDLSLCEKKAPAMQRANGRVIQRTDKWARAFASLPSPQRVLGTDPSQGAHLAQTQMIQMNPFLDAMLSLKLWERRMPLFCFLNTTEGLHIKKNCCN